MSTRACLVITLCCVAAFAPSPALGQQPAAPDNASSAKPVNLPGPTADATRGQARAAKPVDANRPGLVHQESLTGDWKGVRTRWKDRGVQLESSLTQFYQGVASGGTDDQSEYMGTATAELEFDLGKLAGWNHWLAEIKAEMRFGGPLITSTGTISPVNTAAIIPDSDGTVFSVSAVNFTKLFPINLKEGKLWALSFGRYNFVDLLDEDFFAGFGTERFFNIAQIGPLTVLREVPLITNAVTVAYIREGEPFFTFALLDPNDHSTDPGLSNLFADGVTFAGHQLSEEVLRQDRQAHVWRRHYDQGLHAV
jgi:porin